MRRWWLPLACLGTLMLQAPLLRAAAPQAGDVLAADAMQNRVLLVRPSDGSKTVVTTSPLPAKPGCAVLAPDGGFYVVVAPSYLAAGVVRVDPRSGVWTWVVPVGSFSDVRAMRLDTDGALLVLDANAASSSISRIALPGGVVSPVVPPSAVLGFVSGFAVRPDGDLYLGTPGRILRWSRSLGQASLFVNTGEISSPGCMALLPGSNSLVVAFADGVLDVFKIVPFDTRTGGKGTATRGFNLITDITVMPDGTPAISYGGAQVWRITAPGTATVLFQEFGSDPIGPVAFRGLGFVDASTPLMRTTWGSLKARFR